MEMSALAEKKILTEKIDTLKTEHYDEMLVRINKIDSYINAISIRHTEDLVAIITACRQVTEEMQAYITNRQHDLLVYIDQLIDKRMNSHDCTNCKGSCKLQHSEQLIFFEATYGKMVEVFKDNLTVFARVTETIFPDIVRLLHNQLILLESALTEAFFFETTQIRPLIYKMQQAIGAIK